MKYQEWQKRTSLFITMMGLAVAMLWGGTATTYAGSKRLVFSWRNDGSGGSQPPAAIDSISLTEITLIPDRTVNLSTAGTLQSVADIAGV
ncbi:MAG: hypothetical protein LBR97_00620, partial [Dysgonamonadaceae bacterium]|nr:hypothetical protein [Dysgonamonadaceae bacterium]